VNPYTIQSDTFIIKTMLFIQNFATCFGQKAIMKLSCYRNIRSKEQVTLIEVFVLQNVVLLIKSLFTSGHVIFILLSFPKTKRMEIKFWALHKLFYAVKKIIVTIKMKFDVKNPPFWW
jgi:hypothetical protein